MFTFQRQAFRYNRNFLQVYNRYILASQFVRNVKRAHCTKADLFHPTILVDKTYMKLHTEIYKANFPISPHILVDFDQSPLDIWSFQSLPENVSRCAGAAKEINSFERLTVNKLHWLGCWCLDPCHGQMPNIHKFIFIAKPSSLWNMTQIKHTNLFAFTTINVECNNFMPGMSGQNGHKLIFNI